MMVRFHPSQPGTSLRLALPEAGFDCGGCRIVPAQAPRTEDLKQRVEIHNLEEVKSTKSYLPLQLIHYEAYKTKSDAKRREKYLKTNRGRTTLMTMLKDYFEQS